MTLYFLGEKLIVDGQGVPFASVSGVNVLSANADANVPSRSNPVFPREVMWSGWMGESAFTRDFRAWGKEAWSTFDAWCDLQLPRLVTTGVTLCFRPHPRHTLSDAQSCVSFLKKRAGQPFRVLLDPVGMLTSSMIPRAEDHLHRIMDALADHSGVAGVMVSNAVSSTIDPELLAPAPVHRGAVEPKLIRAVFSRIPAEQPVIMLNEEVPAQLALLNAPATAPR